MTVYQRERPLRSGLAVLRADAELLVLPIASFVVTVIVVAAPFLALVILHAAAPRPMLFLLAPLFFLWFLLPFVTLFFSAAMIGAATDRLEGRDPTIRSSIRFAMGHRRRIMRWSFYTAAVGTALGLIPRDNLIGWAVGTAADITWAAVACFVLPIILFENKTPSEALSAARALAGRRTTEAVRGGFTLPLAVGLLVTIFLGGSVALLLAEIAPWPVVFVGLVPGVFVGVTGRVVVAAYQAAAYRDATLKAPSTGWQIRS